MTWEIYRDRAGEWRWRLKASNGRVIADSGEGYVNKSDLIAMVDKIRVGARNAILVDVDEGNGKNG